jgi:two-component system nitrogen regulation sensor histidine kinase NtrY
MKRRINFERRINLLALAAGLPGSLLAGILLWTGDFSTRTQWTLTVLVLVSWVWFAAALRDRVVFPLRTFSNLLAALREGDFSFRMRTEEPNGALGEVMLQVNAMAETLREQRLSALEATTLLRKVMAEIDVAVFAFDSEQRLRLVNRAGERLIAQPAERIMTQRASDLGLSEYLEGETPPIVRTSFPGGSGLWGARRTEFREHGLRHTLLVITNLTQPLRQEELEAWQRLVRVLGHEINNSLAPVKSISYSLADLLARDPLPDDWREDARSGLNAIANRSEALSRFTGAYSRLARLPRPELQPVEVSDWIGRVVRLETRLPVSIKAGPAITIPGDPDQLEQLLINLVRNAVDAALETKGAVRVAWSAIPGYVEVIIEDDGLGFANPSNLFIPFFTTKPQGSGIGLVLSRQIAEAHGGELTLRNRENASGCEARLRLPV